MTPMFSGRVIPHRLPVCPGRDSRYTVMHHRERPGGPWWVHYDDPSGQAIPADDPHEPLVTLVNTLKEQHGGAPGGAFSITEHGQVIARTHDPEGRRNAVHLLGLTRGRVATYGETLTFRAGELDPSCTPEVGAVWPGPLCGMTYSFAAPGSRKAPSDCLDEIFFKVGDRIPVLSCEAGIDPYPPQIGELAGFLLALRSLLPDGGRFRVNEHGRAFTSDDNIYIGTVPLDAWFPPLTARS